MISCPQKVLFHVLFLLFWTNYVLNDTVNRTPARILAKQTGAAQFEEHIEQPVHRDCNEHHHRLRKRSSDEDLDYEVYQGVVGRPGIDFPIFPRIPQTTFSCRTYGNGYFADLETTCQVFHICEEGRKISFLCPNGTIFQQSELTCDWWFKVNCAGSPGYYAESSEILSKARRHRIKVNGIQKGFTNNNKVAENIPDSRHYKGSDRRIDSNENPSVESFDFEDVSDDRSNDKSSERSIDRSIDASNDRSSYKSNNRPTDRSSVRFNEKSSDRSNDRSSDRSSDRSNERSNDRSNDRQSDRSNNRYNDRSNDRSSSKSNSRTNNRTNNNQSNNRSNDKLKQQKQEIDNSHRDENQQQHNDHELQITAETSSFVKNPKINSYSNADKTLNKESEFKSGKLTDKAKDAQSSKSSQSPSRGSQKHTYSDNETSKQKAGNDKPASFFITTKPDIDLSSTSGKVGFQSTAYPEHYTNKNSLDEASSNEKQFVTPTSDNRLVLEAHSTPKPNIIANGPIVSRVTTPSQYPGTYSTARRIDTTRTTPFYTPTVPAIARSKPTESKSYFVNVKTDEPTTLRGAITTDYATPKPVKTPVKEEKNSDIHRFSIFSNGDLNVQVPSRSDSPSNTAGSPLKSSTSGPTYLPKTTKGNLVTSSGADNLITRNMQGILQTVGVLKETMKNNLDSKNSNSSPRVGLEIPPSSGPGTLLSLTNYFANDDQTLSTTTNADDEKSTLAPSTDINISSGLLSNKTSVKYLSLFGLGHDNTTTNDYFSASTVAPKVVYTPTVVGDFTRTTIRDLVQDPETRKIAQVFSNAITKYIENPETFRKDLIDVRPQPPSGQAANVRFESTTPSSNLKKATTTSAFKNVATTTLGNSRSKTTQKYLPSTTETYETTTIQTKTESNDIAKEINNQFDVSTPAYGSISSESTETTTYRSGTSSTSKVPKMSLETGISSELLPPSVDEESEYESLHKVQSQSFVKSYNDLTKNSKSNGFDAGKNSFDRSGGKGQSNQAQTESPWSKYGTTQTDDAGDVTFTTTIKQDSAETTENPWSQSKKPVQKNNFDTTTQKPRTNINQWSTTTEKTPLLKGKTTRSPSWAYSSTTPAKNNFKIESATTSGNSWFNNKLSTVKPTENPWSQITQSIYLDPLTINDGLMREQKTTTSKPFNYVNTDRSRFEDVSQGEDGIDDILNSPELSSELLPKNNGLQRIANKIFGGLNETEALHLQNVMKKAEHNQSVLRLLLLLIQTCDDQNGKALEKSRKILLSALIGMDDKLKIKNTSRGSTTTTNRIPVTTYHRVFNDKSTPTSTTTTTTSASTTTTELSNSNEQTTRFEIRVPDPEDEEENAVTTSKSNAVSSDRQSYNNPNRTSDQRALELLKSLYSLASKFSRR